MELFLYLHSHLYVNHLEVINECLFYIQLTDSLPQPYKEEIEGISSVSGLPVSTVTLYNVFYEAFTFCTSLVIEDQSGHLYHARNLDTGVFLG